MDRAVREMTLEEEVALYRQEAKAVFAKEDPTSEAPEVNNILRRGMRVIRKAEERIAAMQDSRLGRWEITILESSDRVFRTGPPHCSVCGQRAFLRTPFCPNCGAKMDLEVQ